MQLVHRTEALTRIFRESQGRRSFTIAALRDEVVRKYPHLYETRPSEDTISRAVKALIDAGVPIEQSTAAKRRIAVKGSPKQLVWTYAAEAPLLESVKGISNDKERAETIISLATAADALAGVAGLRVHDLVLKLLDSIERDESMVHLARGAKRDRAKYSFGNIGKRITKAKKVLRGKQQLERLRTLDECVRENHRVKITHRHKLGQKNEQDHIIEPVALRDRNGSTLVVGFEVGGRKLLKQFKLDRIVKVEDLKKRNQFEYDDDGKLTGRLWPAGLRDIPPFPLDKILGNSIHDFLPSPWAKEVSRIVIEVRSELANWVKEEMLNPRQMTTDVTLPDGTKGLRVDIERAYVDDITPRIVGLAQHVKVLAPPELVDHIGSTLRRAADQYRSPPAVGEGGKPAAPTRAR